MSTPRNTKQAEAFNKEVCYQQLKGQKIPDVSLAITNSVFSVSLQNDLPKRYVLVVQPGGLSSYQYPLPSSFISKGMVGCTVEACGFHKYLDNFKILGFGVFFLNCRPPIVQQKAKEEKYFNIDFLSDENLLLAKALGIRMREVELRIGANESRWSFLDRLTLIVENGVISEVIDQIADPAKTAELALERLLQHTICAFIPEDEEESKSEMRLALSI